VIFLLIIVVFFIFIYKHIIKLTEFIKSIELIIRVQILLQSSRSKKKKKRVSGLKCGGMDKVKKIKMGRATRFIQSA
jgi:hypothetical protein